MKHKVCILTSVHFYNDNRVYYKEVLSLFKLGYDVTYMAPNVEGHIQENIHAINVYKNPNTFKRIFGFFHIFKQVKKLDCEIVHFQDPELIPVGILLKIFTKKKVIYDVHEDYPAQMLTKFYLKHFLRIILKRLMKFAEWISGNLFDAIVVADSSVYTHFPIYKTTILYNYPSLHLLQESDSELKNIEKEYDIIFPGSMAKFTAKIILDIMLEAKKRGRKLKCLLISPFHFEGGKKWVIETAMSYGVYENLTLMDRIPPYDVPRYLKSTKIGLIPLPDTLKMRANIPTKMFEYMYFGLPVLTSDLPPCGQYLNKYKFGYLIQYDDYKKYTDIILDLLDNPIEISKLGDLGHSLVIDEYNWEREELKLNEIYKNLLC